jgi:hypothetical protein
MRTLTIIVVFVGLNSLGFLYRVVGHHRSSAAGSGLSSTAAAPTTPTAPPITSPITATERVSPLTPGMPVEPPGSVLEPTLAKPANQQMVPSTNQKIAEPVARHSSSPAAVTPRAGQQRKPVVVPRPAIVARPRVTPDVAAPAPARTAGKPENKPDNNPDNKPDKKSDNKADAAVHMDDNLKKMEANPYKRGE